MFIIQSNPKLVDDDTNPWDKRYPGILADNYVDNRSI